MKKSALFILTIISFSFFQCRKKDNTITDCPIVIGTYSNVNALETEYIYNEDYSRIEKAVYYNNPERFTDYAYDEAGNMVQVTSFFNPNTPIRYDYVYNDDHQPIAGKKFTSRQDDTYELDVEVTYHYNSNNQLDSVSYFKDGFLENEVKLYYNADNPSLIDQTINTYHDTTSAIKKWIYNHYYGDVKNPNLPKIVPFSPEFSPQLSYTEYAREITESIFIARSDDTIIDTYHYFHKFENDCLKSISRTHDDTSRIITEFFYQE